MSDSMLLLRSQPGRCSYCLSSMWVEYETDEFIDYECHCGSVSRAWKVKEYKTPPDLIQDMANKQATDVSNPPFTQGG